MARFLLSVLVTLVLVGVTREASAQPFGVRTSHFANPATSIAIGWNSDGATDAVVRYGADPSALTMEATADSFAMGGDLATGYTARLTGLSPDTVYHYQVGSAGRFHPSSGAFSFRTFAEDPCAGFRFIVIGDNRADLDGMGPNPLWSNILEEALDEMPDLFVNTGDMVKNGEDTGEWANFIDASEPLSANVASIFTMGNHDEDDVNGDMAIYNRLFELGRNSRTDTEDYYSVDIGPIHFISLNTQFSRPGTTEMDEMVAWLEEDLMATSQPWKVAFFHKSMYSRGNHATGEEDNGALNLAFIPLFDRFDVDLVFSGHSHDYERYVPSTGVDSAFGGSGRAFPLGDASAVGGMATLPDGTVGTTYIVTGGAGAFTAPVADTGCLGCVPFPIPGVCDCDTDVLDMDMDGNIIFDGRHNYVIVDVDADELRIDVIATRTGGGSGSSIDTFTVVKSDFPTAICGTVPPPMDGGVPLPDGGAPDGGVTDSGAPTGDSSVPRTDSGSPTMDSGVDAGTRPTPGTSSGGCGCRVTGAPTSAGAMSTLALGLLVTWRRRRR